MKIVVPVNVIPKQRARSNGGKFYTPDKTKSCMDELAWAFKCVMKNKKLFTEDLKVSFQIFTLQKAGDLSNYIKLIEDAGNGILWKDDRQIIAYGESWLHRNSVEPLLILDIEIIEKD